MREKPELAKEIDNALATLKPEIAALAVKYSFPQGKPVNLMIVAKVGTAKPGEMNAVQVPAHMVARVQSNATDTASPPANKASKPKSKAASNAANAGLAAKAATKAAGGGVANQEAVAQTPALSQTALLGRVRFNDQCSHCHGSDGASPLRERDVRRLKMRYDAKWKDVALTTIKNGRNDLGMPPWKDILKEPDIEQLLSFLETLQK
jgi:mono/diheme cytochrome c family protein